MHTTTNNDHGTFEKHEWEIKLQIAQSYADKASKGDPEKYLHIMNNFLISVGLTPLNISPQIIQSTHATQSSPITQIPSPNIPDPLTPITSFTSTHRTNLNTTPLPKHTNSTPATSPSEDSSSPEISVTSSPETHNNTVIIRNNPDSNSPQQLHIVDNSTQEATTPTQNSNLDLQLSTSYTDTSDIESVIPGNQLNKPQQRQVRRKKRNKNPSNTHGYDLRQTPDPRTLDQQHDHS